MATAKLTPLQELEARRNAPAGPKRVISEEEKATRKDRVAKAKDALADRSAPRASRLPRRVPR